MASGNASLHATWEGPLGIPLHLVPGPKSCLEPMSEPEDSSPVLTCTSAFLPSCSSSVSLPFELTMESVASPRGFPRGLSHAPTWCELIHCVTVEAVQGNQVPLAWTETYGGLLVWWRTPGVTLDFLVLSPSS